MNFLEPIDAETVIAVFGSATLVQKPNGKMELRGGSSADVAEVKEWASLFMPELIIRPAASC